LRYSEARALVGGTGLLLLFLGFVAGRDHPALFLASIVALSAAFEFLFPRSIIPRLFVVGAFWALLFMSIMILPSKAFEVAISWTIVLLAIFLLVLRWARKRDRERGKWANETPWITVRYAAPCTRCHQIIHVGERALWKKGVGIRHGNCNQ
jgi:hypothetical protein